MNAPQDHSGVLLLHGGYRKLRSYKVAQAVYDAPVGFCRRFYPHDRRMTDQMVQAARSGVRNISEGSGMAATSRKGEMKLTNVARASLSDELCRDYETFLRQNGLRVWPKDSGEARAMRARLAQDRVENLPPPPSGGVRLRGCSCWRSLWKSPRRSWRPTRCSARRTRRPTCSSASSKARATPSSRAAGSWSGSTAGAPLTRSIPIAL